jgi:hypothetical protein
MDFVYLGILIAGVFSAVFAWRRYRSRVIVHRVDYAEERLTVKNIGWVGARSVILYVAKDREMTKEIADPPPNFEKLADEAEDTKAKGQRLEDIPPGAIRTVDLDWIRVGKEWARASVCVGTKWKPDWWFDQFVSQVTSTDQISMGDSWRQTFVRLPGYARGKRQFSSN